MHCVRQGANLYGTAAAPTATLLTLMTKKPKHAAEQIGWCLSHHPKSRTFGQVIKGSETLSLPTTKGVVMISPCGCVVTCPS